MKLDRRQFLAGLISVGATIVLPVALTDATPAQVDNAWKQLLNDPWYFDVNWVGTIIDSSVPEPQIRSDAFEDIWVEGIESLQDLIRVVESCTPLTSHFRQLAFDELDRMRLTLESDEYLSPSERSSLVKLVETLEDSRRDWSDWVLLVGPSGLSRFIDVVDAWLASPIEGDDYQWFPNFALGQGRAMQFFESMPNDLLEALGVAIIEGDHPGSTYYAAVLRTNLAAANETARIMELPFRFRAG